MKNVLIDELRTNRVAAKAAMTAWSRAKHAAKVAEVNDKVYGTVSDTTVELKARAVELEAQRDALWEYERELVAKICVCIAVNADSEYRDDIVDDLYKSMIIDGVDRKELSEEMAAALVDYVNIHRLDLNDI